MARIAVLEGVSFGKSAAKGKTPQAKRFKAAVQSCKTVHPWAGGSRAAYRGCMQEHMRVGGKKRKGRK